MLAIEVELLTGRYAATTHNDRGRAEWPPHPARFFSALVAALHDRDPTDDEERAALRWLEEQEPPQIDVDPGVGDASGRRDVRSVFVPVNDITLVGDPEKSLREARSALAALEAATEDKGQGAQVRKARKEVEKQERELATVLRRQREIPAHPSKVNLERAAALLPDRRMRQERTFPVVVPERTTFALFWPTADPAQYLGPLGRLCDRVTRLGHSSSLVRCAIVQRAIDPSLVPAASGRYILRVVGPGQLRRLEEAYRRHQAVEPRVLPFRAQRYDKPEAHAADPLRSVFTEDWIVFERVDGDRPLASRGGDLAAGLRSALIEVHGAESLPASLSGHSRDGTRAEAPHVAFVALPWVGHEHADGSVQGLALILPRTIAPSERETLLRLVARWQVQRGDADLVIELGTPAGIPRPLRLRLRHSEVPTKASLRAERWCRPSRRFLTATPIALDRHPGNLRSNHAQTAHKAAAEAQATVAGACEAIGLPRPLQVAIALAPLLPGGQHVREYAPWPPQPGRTRRARVHAEIVFEAPVRGPVLVGAGRYFGLGLCLPVADEAGR